ncbi:MAG: twin-arginine translocase TatA/TatE family subunit [Anaerolineales bacterium]|nr:twin-arginine translocase TatA/TatE family subunit [Anaerolineales bacterium]MDW8278234.1 twin-arginine translocase TatA/TatE family subunit [Anaerolineales bacterium]
MVRLGPTELIIILVIVIILFGPGRLGNVLGELGKGLRSFKDALSGEKDETPKSEKSDQP